MMLQRLRRLFRYDHWANRETLASIERASPAPVRALRRMGHIVGAERLWLARLLLGPPPPVWPELDVRRCADELEDLRSAWDAFLSDLDENGLERAIEYVNSKGEPWRSAVDDVLLHVVQHSAYHRGQIAADLRAAGHEPAYTDYVHAIRTGLVPR
jgi:uncharacterized damage-inducible protein DinB